DKNTTFLRKERHHFFSFFRSEEAGMTDSWKEALGIIKTKAMDFAKNDPERSDHKGMYEEIFKISRSRYPFFKPSRQKQFERMCVTDLQENVSPQGCCSFLMSFLSI